MLSLSLLSSLSEHQQPTSKAKPQTTNNVEDRRKHKFHPKGKSKHIKESEFITFNFNQGGKNESNLEKNKAPQSFKLGLLNLSYLNIPNLPPDTHPKI